MAYEHNEGCGSLFPNRAKESTDNRPDYKGSIKINGEVIYLAMWKKAYTEKESNTQKVRLDLKVDKREYLPDGMTKADQAEALAITADATRPTRKSASGLSIKEVTAQVLAAPSDVDDLPF